MTLSIEAKLEALIDRDRAERDLQHCLDTLSLCNLCAKELSHERFVIDGEVKGTPQVSIPDGTSVGQWAYMCQTCYARRAVGIAWGTGQLYERTPDGYWLLVPGFSPE